MCLLYRSGGNDARPFWLSLNNRASALKLRAFELVPAARSRPCRFDAGNHGLCVYCTEVVVMTLAHFGYRSTIERARSNFAPSNLCQPRDLARVDSMPVTMAYVFTVQKWW